MNSVSHPNDSYWYSMIELHVRRNALLQMREDLAPLHESNSDRDTKNSKIPDIDLSKIRDTLLKSERLLFSQIVQLQNVIQTSDIANIRQKYDMTVEEKIDRERQKFTLEKSLIKKELDLTKTTVVKLERDMAYSNDETRGLCGVIHEVESQNKEFRERIEILEKQLRKAKKNLSNKKKGNKAKRTYLTTSFLSKSKTNNKPKK